MTYDSYLNEFAKLRADRKHAARRKMAGERAAAARRTLNLKICGVTLQYMLHDRKPESRAAGCARASRVGTIEALGETRYVLGLNANAGICHREVPALGVRTPAHLD